MTATATVEWGTEGREAPLATIARRYFEHDAEARTHARGVARLSLGIALELGVKRTYLTALALGAILHDVGKLQVPRAVLAKPGRLTEDEWRLVRSHPACGERLLAPHINHPVVLSVVRSHHERHDGDGYPDGLRNGQSPLLARIVTVADAYEAMTAERPYRAALPRREAFSELRACAGSQFDPVCVAALVRVVEARTAHAA